MHIYAFGSICRGAIEPTSDVDLLALVDGHDNRFNPEVFSIYSYDRIDQLWKSGNPFAWHLFYESKIIHSDDGKNYILEKGSPNPYKAGKKDCEKFYQIFLTAKNSILHQKKSSVFDLGTIFLAIRNAAMCFSLQAPIKPTFSRDSAICLGVYSLSINPAIYSILKRSRLLSTRGMGMPITPQECVLTIECLSVIDNWMSNLIAEVTNDRI